MNGLSTPILSLQKNQELIMYIIEIRLVPYSILWITTEKVDGFTFFFQGVIVVDVGTAGCLKHLDS